MKNRNYLRSIICGGLILLSVFGICAQRRSKTVVKPKTIVFAVINDGQTLEPIGQIDKGELTAIEGEDDQKDIVKFGRTYYQPKTNYSLIFGGKLNGLVTVKKFDPKSECGKNLATMTTKSARVKLKGLVMALATNNKTSVASNGIRRLPTFSERAEAESLARSEFAKQGVSDEAVKKMDYLNLTAVDVDNDGKAELVGTFWAENSAAERNQLFFIAEQNSSGKYEFGYSDYKKVTPDEVMSGDLKDLKGGIGNELLLDIMEYNGDKTAEIFTINQSFEGNNFHVYSRVDGKWKKVFEGYNYHCAY